MNASTPSSKLSWFNAFKYCVYALLIVNIFIFFQDDWQAFQYTHSGPLYLPILVEAFATTIDTTAWVILLLLFELETYQIPDEKLTGRLKALLHGVRALCFLTILYAFYGYLARCLALYDYQPTELLNLCALAGQSSSYMLGHDSYVILDAQNCIEIATAGGLWVNAAGILSDTNALETAKWLSWTDVANAGAWILVVLVLEADVRLQLRGLLKGSVLLISKSIKLVLYTILLLAAIYWWFDGAFIDFWDAFLWIVAFVFIELNIFKWQSETSSSAPQRLPAAS